MVTNNSPYGLEHNWTKRPGPAWNNRDAIALTRGEKFMIPNERRRRHRTAALIWLTAALLSVGAVTAAGQQTWQGLRVTPEQRCSAYNADDYSYPQSVELDLIANMGGVYGPYTGRWFRTRYETDIEHMVARSEAHDSGMCARSLTERRRFATDPLNLTLAGPQVNRYEKVAKDAAEWMPAQNQCWYAASLLMVRQRYNLTIDQREATAMDRVLSGCSSTAMVVFPPTSPPAPASGRPAAAGEDALAQWDDNRNGRISCAEARGHRIAPVQRDHPAYRFMRDGDGDGVVCER